MRKKIFHDRWDGTTRYETGDCDECGVENVPVAVFVAEENQGEIYTVSVCRDCLLAYADGLGWEEA
jgi:hypothetical protein